MFGMYEGFLTWGSWGRIEMQFWCGRDGARRSWSCLFGPSSTASNAVKLHKYKAYFRLTFQNIYEAG